MIVEKLGADHVPDPWYQSDDGIQADPVLSSRELDGVVEQPGQTAEPLQLAGSVSAHAGA